MHLFIFSSFYSFFHFFTPPNAHLTCVWHWMNSCLSFSTSADTCVPHSDGGAGSGPGSCPFPFMPRLLQLNSVWCACSLKLVRLRLVFHLPMFSHTSIQESVPLCCKQLIQDVIKPYTPAPSQLCTIAPQLATPSLWGQDRRNSPHLLYIWCSLMYVHDSWDCWVVSSWMKCLYFKSL